MALSYIDHIIFKNLKAAGLLPTHASILEFGEASWYGDVSTEVLSDAIEDLVEDKQQREDLHQRMVEILCGDSQYKAWDLAKIFYKVFLDYSKIMAIDLHGTPAAHKLDLNQPLSLTEQFDVIMNSGTAEHVFNICQFFKTSHEFTKPGGLMFHTVPFRGLLEHGFYSINPTFFWDLAAANGYSVLLLAYAQLASQQFTALKSRRDILDMARRGALGADALLYAVMKKSQTESVFRIPIQGGYAE